VLVVRFIVEIGSFSTVPDAGDLPTTESPFDRLPCAASAYRQHRDVIERFLVPNVLREARFDAREQAGCGLGRGMKQSLEALLSEDLSRWSAGLRHAVREGEKDLVGGEMGAPDLEGLVRQHPD
jgi:hypothetical protein